MSDPIDALNEDESGGGAGKADATPERTPSELSLAERFDPKRLRLSQDFGKVTTTPKVLTSVPVTKPSGLQWVRVRPEPDFCVNVAIIDLKDSRPHLVVPEMLSEISSEVTCVTLFTAITRENNVFLWPVRLPGPDGRPNAWNDTLREAALAAMQTWVRVKSNLALGCYEFRVAPGAQAEPQWPDLDFGKLLGIAFKNRVIDALDHPVLQRLQGLR